ncbi:MAG: carbohydrate ABC transporter substrate-binding protein [Eubacteriales bacterium]|nr:carbohydrate ABC transporter substrate-binding protein [Eubacteriales bacterium]
MKKSMKAIIAMMLAAVTCVSLLSGCGASTTETQAAAPQAAAEATQAAREAAAQGSMFAGKTLKLALFEGGYGMDCWNQTVEAFQKYYPDVTIEVQHNPQIGDVVRPQMIAGEYPDIYYCNGDNDELFRSLLNEKQLWDMTDWYNSTPSWDDESKTVADTIVAGLLSSTTCAPYRDGRIYGAPFVLTSRGVVYNRTLWEKNGWTFPETWDELFTILDEAKAKGIAGWTYAAANAPDYVQSMLMPSLVSALGVEKALAFVDYDESILDTPEFKQLLETYAKLGDYLLDGTLGLNHTESQAEFMQDKCLFIPNGDWISAEMADAPRTDGFVWGMAAPPVNTVGETHYSRSSPGILTVPANGGEHELAMEFIRFMYSKEGIEIWAKTASQLIPVEGAAEIAAPYLDEGFASMHAELDNSATAFAYAWTPIENSKVSINDVIYKTYADVVTKKITVDQWLETIREAFKEKNAARK